MNDTKVLTFGTCNSRKYWMNEFKKYFEDRRDSF